MRGGKKELEEWEIPQFLKKIRHRVLQRRLLCRMGMFGLVGACLCGLCNLIALWIPFYRGEWIGFGLFVVSLLCACIYTLFTWPREKETAEIADAIGGKERFTTYLEHREKQDLMSRLQREDTKKQIAVIPWKQRLPLVLPRRTYLGMLLLLAGSVLCACYTTPAKREAEKAHILTEQRAKAEAQVAKVQKELQEQKAKGKLSQKEYKRLQNILEQNRKELEESVQKEGIDKAKERLETKLIRELSSQNTDPLSLDTVKSLQALTPEKDLVSMSEYQHALKQLAKTSNTVATAKEELSDLGELLDSAQQKELVSALQKADSDGVITAEELSDALLSLNEANAAYAEATLNQGETTSSSNQSGGESSGANGDNSDGNGNGSGSGSGQSSGSGNHAAAGSGTGGGMNRGSSQGMERTEKAGKAEQVWVPEETRDDPNLTGQKKGASSKRVKTEKGLTRKGKKADLKAVSGQYRRKAYSKLQKQRIPDSMEELVKQYFSELDQ